MAPTTGAVMVVTHAVTMNGRISMALAGDDGRSCEEELIHRLGLLDGVRRFSLMLWRIPEGVAFDHVDLRALPMEFMQCAGHFAERLTCEVRDGDANTGALCVVGRRPADGESPRDEAVPWNDHRSIVQTNEVLNGDEVAELFVSYYRTGDLPASYRRRKIEI